MDKVGKDGVISVEESKGLGIRDRIRRRYAVGSRLYERLLHYPDRHNELSLTSLTF